MAIVAGKKTFKDDSKMYQAVQALTDAVVSTWIERGYECPQMTRRAVDVADLLLARMRDRAMHYALTGKYPEYD